MDQAVKRWVALWAAALVVAIIFIPAVLVKSIGRDGHDSFIAMLRAESNQPSEVDAHEANSDASQGAKHTPNTEHDPNAPYTWHVHEDGVDIYVSVYLVESGQVVAMPLEQYVRGVVAAEMPAEFELEALKAQAIAARSYIIRRMLDDNTEHVPVANALVTDGIAHQVFYTDEKIQALWKPDAYEHFNNKINQAINETEHIVVTYQGEPIDASYFSTSNGFTENSEDYWQVAKPYLRSVPSPWDITLSPRFEEQISMPYETVINKLGLSLDSLGSEASTGVVAPAFIVLERTAGHRIKRVIIGDKTFTGREVREQLGLNSTQFQMELNGNDIQFTMFGYGHGIGMSQWGAQGMALEGRTAEEILKYFYQGTALNQIAEL